MGDKAEVKEFAKPDEVRTFERGQVELISIGDGEVGRFTLQPGWHWAEHIKHLVGTDLCEQPHFQTILSGTIHVKMADGTEFDAGPGSVLKIPPGHDAWIVGDEALVAIDWTGAENYAKG